MQKPSSSQPSSIIDLTRDEDEEPTHRERHLLSEIESLKRQLKQRQPTLAAPSSSTPSASASSSASSGPASSSSKHPTLLSLTSSSAQSALADFLADPHCPATEVDRYLRRFSTQAIRPPALARLCYETLLDDVTPVTTPTVLAKLRVLSTHRLYCPATVWRSFRRVESLELAVAQIGQDALGRLALVLYQSMSPVDPPSLADLYTKLDGADLLMVAHHLAPVLGLGQAQARVLVLVHYGRHGPLSKLQQVITSWVTPVASTSSSSSTSSPATSSSSATTTASTLRLNRLQHNGFPLLFQPLIEMESGWLDRLRVLVQAGGSDSANQLYAPWNCNALHMLCYSKPGSSSSTHPRPPESQLVQATQLLLTHGAAAPSILNRVDTSGRTALMQAASDGRYQVCLVLLGAGADADLVDQESQSMLDLLFYLKHSNQATHRRASAGYSCMDLYGMVNRFGLGVLMTDELKQDCRGCGTCRYLLASVPAVEEADPNQGMDQGEDEEEEEKSEEEEDEEKQEAEGLNHSSSSSESAHPMSISSSRRTHPSVGALFARLRL